MLAQGTRVGELVTCWGSVGPQDSSAGKREEREENQKIVNDDFPLSFLPGEPFSQEEMEEMLSAAVHPESNSIYYKDYLTMMVVDEN